MKKNLIVTLAAIALVAMVVPASASTLTVGGDLNASWTYDAKAVTPDSELNLNLTFKEGDAIAAYLPLTFKNPLDGGKADYKVGKWYFAYNADPAKFWVSNNDPKNKCHFEELGDPMGIGADLGTGVVANTRINLFGADVNLYGARIGKDNDVLGRVVIPLPADFKLGVVGTYQNTEGAATAPTLALGADVAGKLPGIGGDVTLAGAGSFEYKDNKFAPKVTTNDYIAYMAKLENLNAGPVTVKGSYIGVGASFAPQFKVSPDDDGDTILNANKGNGVAEIVGTATIPVAIPTEVTLGDVFTQKFQGDPTWNEINGKVKVTPIKDLDVIVSGAYKADLNKNDEAIDLNADPVVYKDVPYAGYKGHAEVAYNAFGLKLNPYVDYKVDSYADYKNHGTDAAPKYVDTIIGAKVTGNPATGLTVGLTSWYKVEDTAANVLGHGIYTTEVKPEFLKSAKSTVAGVAGYEMDNFKGAKENEYHEPVTKKVDDKDEVQHYAGKEPTTTVYGFAGSEFEVNNAFSGKVGVLTADKAGKAVASANLTYTLSDKLSANATYTYRAAGIKPADGVWQPFEDKEGNNWLKLGIDGKVGKSTIGIAYGADGLAKADTTGFEAGKPWAYLRNRPEKDDNGVPMDWELVTLSVKVPF